MKKLLLILGFITVLSACQKDDGDEKRVAEPKVVSAVFNPAYSGSNVSLRAKVNVEIPDGIQVKELKLMLNTVEKFKVDNPKTGEHILFDHTVTDYPVGKYYVFAFVKSDNTIILSEPYRVSQ